MKNERLTWLLDSYVAKNITPAEENELLALIADNKNDEQVKNHMAVLWEKNNTGHRLNTEQSEKILSFILKDNGAKMVPLHSRQRKKAIAWAAAAAIFIIGTVGLYYQFSKPPASQNITAKNNPAGKYKNDVLPGTNGAILKLADGTSIVLDSAANGTLSQQGSMTLVKNGGSLNYVPSGKTANHLTAYNTIETPKGRQFELVLEDGTKVWLNAASSIHFPVLFGDKERKVDITGEAYFEVAKNKDRPFRVSVNGTTVEVLGTHFNINSYPDEASLNTTLLEGSVKVIKANNIEILMPGQQAQVNQSGAINKLRNVNTDEVVAWKNNTFSFNKTDIKKLMRQLERWYDVDIEYKNPATAPVKFNGAIPRSATLSNVLKMLELTGEVSFAIEGKKIIVSTEN